MIDKTQEVSGVAYNNIYYNVRTNVYNSTVHDYNWSSGSNDEPHGIGNSSDPFVDVNGGDFRLYANSSARNAGTVLDAKFAYDADGNTRESQHQCDHEVKRISARDTGPDNDVGGR